MTCRELLQTRAAAVELVAGQLVLDWMGQRDTPVIPIVGVSRVEQLRSAWTAVHINLSPDLLTELDGARS